MEYRGVETIFGKMVHIPFKWFLSGIDNVDSAIDGYSAIDKCSKRWSVNQDFYKLIFMDLEMPRIDGF